MERKNKQIFTKRHRRSGDWVCDTEFTITFTMDEIKTLPDMVLSDVPEEYRRNALFHINSDMDGDYCHLELYASYYRPETDEEMNLRIKREEKEKEEARKRHENFLKHNEWVKKQKEEAEYASYLELHAKWGKKEGGE